MKKKSIIFGLVGIIGVSSLIPTYTFAVDTDDLLVEKAEVMAEVKQEIMPFSLEKAIDYALKNSKDIIIQEVELQKAKVSYEDKIRGIKTSEKNVDYIFTRDPLTGAAIPDASINIALIESGASRRMVELPYQIAKWNVGTKKNQVKYNVEKAYYDLFLIEKEFEISKENLELSQKQYKLGKLKYDLGTISQQQLLGLEMGLLQAQTGYDSLKMYKDLQIMSFQNTLGLPFNQQVRLTDTIKRKEYEKIDLVASIKEALGNNVGIKIAQESYELSELTLKAVASRYPDITYRYREQEAEVAKAAKNLDMARNGVEMGVRSAYLNLLTAENQIATYEKTIEQAVKGLKMAELNFDLGQNTHVEVIQASINLMNAKKGLSQQIHAFNMALLDFEYGIGIGK